MVEDNIVQKIKGWKPMSKRPIGRPKTRWEDDVLEGIKSINVDNWKEVAQNRDKSSPVTGLDWPRGFQEIKFLGFHDNGTGWL